MELNDGVEQAMTSVCEEREGIWFGCIQSLDSSNCWECGDDRSPSVVGDRWYHDPIAISPEIAGT